jgi:hypothetical protein
MQKRCGCDGRPAGERQFALRANEGPAGDHLMTVVQELSLELGGVRADGARGCAILALITEIWLDQRHDQE